MPLNAPVILEPIPSNADVNESAALLASALSFGAMSDTAAAATEDTPDSAPFTLLPTAFSGAGIASAALLMALLAALSAPESPDLMAPSTPLMAEDTPDFTPENALLIPLAAALACAVRPLNIFEPESELETALPTSPRALFRAEPIEVASLAALSVRPETAFSASDAPDSTPEERPSPNSLPALVPAGPNSLFSSSENPSMDGNRVTYAEPTFAPSAIHSLQSEQLVYLFLRRQRVIAPLLRVG